eukprot:9440960-Lingulodinium_polyedra.AAC.1
MQPMMSSRQRVGDAIVGPTYQHAANQLIYSQTDDWHRISIEAVGRRVRGHLPREMQEPWHRLNRRGMSYRSEGAQAAV